MTRIALFLLIATLVSCTKTEIQNSGQRPYDIFVPNAFSPNGDGVNDTFKPIFPDHTPPLESYKLEIYDGDLVEVFNSTDTSMVWDGRSSDGSTLPAATYYLKLYGKYVTGENYDVSGAITLARP